MIFFPPLRTRRLDVQLRELTLGEAIALCRLPATRYEAAITEFLRCVADRARAPTPAYALNPRLWTVEERARVVAHYLSQVSQTGADFEVGAGRLSDYLLVDRDLSQAEIPLGEVGGRSRILRPLLGVQAEVLERVCEGRGDWLIGLLACQVHDGPAPAYLDMPDVELLEWVRSRMQAVRELPESQFEELFVAFEVQRPALLHFFHTDVTDEGVLLVPAERGAGGALPPARFPAHACLSATVRELFARPDQSGRGDGPERQHPVPHGPGDGDERGG